MTELLVLADVNDWARALGVLEKKITLDPNAVIFEIKSLYGGMGSLNDIVLFSGGKLLTKENIEFDALRGALFDLCRYGCVDQ